MHGYLCYFDVYDINAVSIVLVDVSTLFGISAVYVNNCLISGNILKVCCIWHFEVCNLSE